MRSARSTLKPLGGPRDPRHGTIGGYGYWGCRCARCRTAATESAREQRNSAEVVNHNRYGYDLGCRCEKCTRAAKEAEQARRSAKREWRRTHRHGKTEKADLSKLA